MSNIILRPHQDAAIKTLLQQREKYAVAELCVAAGKSLILGCLAGYRMSAGRVLILAHNKELVQQNVEACESVGIRPGICSSSIGKNVFQPVTVGTYQTVVNRLQHFQGVTDILVDEVHRVPINKTSGYRQIFEGIPRARVTGLTGTTFRADGTGSLEKTFGPIIYRYTFLEALRDGYVKPLVPAHSEEAAAISTEGLKNTKVDGSDEFDLTEMGERAILLAPTHVAATLDVMRLQGRKQALVFACNTKHADALEAEFNKAYPGIAASVHSHSPKGKREKCVAAFKGRRLPILISVAMFDTGFNAVDIDLLVFCRATKSGVFFAQALGRGARLTPHAENCAVLDFGGNVKRHGSLDAIAAAPGVELKCDPCGEQWESWKNGRTCPSCGTLHKTATKCKNEKCGEQFDQFYHGGTCPHCGTIQASLRKCNGCEKSYAAFLHPMCPHCGYDNSSVREVGKDLSEWGGGDEIVSTTEALKREPFQPITRAPFQAGDGRWQLPTKYATVAWPYTELPANLHMVYLEKATNGRIRVRGWYDKTGQVHQL